MFGIMNNRNKKYLIIGIVLIIILSIGTTFAWYTWSSSDEDETKIVTSLGAITVYYDSGSNIEGIRLKPSATKEEGIIKTITVKSGQESKYKLSFNLYLDINTLPDGLKDASFKYELYKIGTEEAIVSGDFTQTSLDTNLVSCTTNSTNHIVLVSDETITTEVSTYVLYIWIDGNMQNDMDMQNQDFEFKIHADGQNAILGETLVQHITSLYENADKTVVSNGAEGSQTQYNYATSVSLMNDRLGGVTSNYDAGNIRYYGKNPNNYVAFDFYDEDFYQYSVTYPTSEYNNYSECVNDISLIEYEWQDSGYDSLAACEQEVDDNMNCELLYSAFGFASVAECDAYLLSSVQSMGYNSLDEYIEYRKEDYCRGELTEKEIASNISSTCGTETLVTAGTVVPDSVYRIIGVFKDVEVISDDGRVIKQDLVKLIKEKSIGYYSYDTSSSDINNGYGLNDWSQSDLMKLINPGYDNNQDLDSNGNTVTVNNSLWWNGENGLCYWYKENLTKECNFVGLGINSNLKELIVNANWLIRKYPNDFFNNYTTYSNSFYSYERNINSSGFSKWNGNVALIYPSDFGYSSDFTQCNVNLVSYDESRCFTKNNWMYHWTNEIWTLGIDEYNGVVKLNPDVYFSFEVAADTIYDGDSYRYYSEVRPTFYIKADTIYVSGSGTYDDPYIVK